jgi:hypothetical protein
MGVLIWLNKAQWHKRKYKNCNFEYVAINLLVTTIHFYQHTFSFQFYLTLQDFSPEKNIYSLHTYDEDWVT